MADRKDPMSSDDLLRQAWVDINRDPDASMSLEADSVELDEVDIPDMSEIDRPSSRSPVDSYVRTKRPAPPPPPAQRPPPPPPQRRSDPPPPPAPTHKSQRKRGRWILVGITVFALLRIFGSFDDSDDLSSESGNAVVVASIEPLLEFEGFDSSSDVGLVGRAKEIDGVVSLTRKEPGNSSGAMWSRDRVPVANGFESLFVFEIDHVSWFSIGDGFAFVIQNAGAGVLGGVASGNGYKGIPNSLAIEFDTVSHDYEGDPLTVMPDASAPMLLANHVAIHTMGSEPNTTHARAKLAHAALDPVRMYDRRSHMGLIRYVPGTLSVFVDNLEDPVLELQVDLDALLTLNGGQAFVGFTASTEGLYADHRIHAWSYASPCLMEGCQDG